jgi:hypothetical protein
MATATLNDEQEALAKHLLEYVRAEIDRAAGSDTAAAFAIRRYVYVRLQHDERSKPMERRKLKMKKFDQQQGRCAMCNQPITELAHTHLHRLTAVGGYIEDNTIFVPPLKKV